MSLDSFLFFLGYVLLEELQQVHHDNLQDYEVVAIQKEQDAYHHSHVIEEEGHKATYQNISFSQQTSKVK